MLSSQHRGSYPGRNESANWRATARYTEGFKKLRTFRGAPDRDLLDDAEKLLREAVVIDPAYQAARFQLGVVEELKGRHEDAAHQFEELLALVDKAQVELFYNTGLAYFHQYSDEAYQKAENYLQKAVEAARNGTIQEQDRQRHQAIGVLARAVLAQVYSHRSIRPVNEMPAHSSFNLLAERYYKKALETADEALKEFENSATIIEKLDPRFKNDIGWGIYNARGHAKLYAARRCEDSDEKEKLFEAALEEFKRALEFDPVNVRVLSNIGSAKLFLAQGHKGAPKSDLLAEAEGEFQRVLTLQPDYDFAYCRLGQVELERRDFEAARRYAELAEKHPSEMTPEYIGDLKRNIEKEVNPSRIYTLQINPAKVGELIGPGGETIRGILEQTGVKIHVEDDGRVNVVATDSESGEKALKIIQDMTAEAEIGKTYLGKVVRLAEFGAFVEIVPGTEGLLHISEVAEHRIQDIRKELKEGDQLLVKVMSIDGNKIRLSRKAVLREQREETGTQSKA